VSVATPPAVQRVLAPAELAAVTGGRWLPGALAPAELRGLAIDSRTLMSGQLFVAIPGPRFDGHDFLAAAAARGASAALVTRRPAEAPPGLALLEVADTSQALLDLGAHARAQARLPIVAVTGSAGKTTTKEIAATLLAKLGPVLKTEGNLNNHLGVPLTLLRLEPQHRAAVLELGMSAAGELRRLTHVVRPQVAVITLVAAAHLEFFDSLDAIAAAKSEILEGLDDDGLAVLNFDDPRLRALGLARRASGRRVAFFGRDRACDVSAEHWRGSAHGMRFDLHADGRSVDVALALPGLHNVTNFLAAASAARALGLDLEHVAAAASDVRPAAHRGEVRRLAEGVTLYDDCYNSSPAAVEAALAALAMTAHVRRVAVLGDMLELGPTGAELHHAVGASLAGRVEVVIAVGPLGQHLLAGARAAGLAAAALVHCAHADDAVAALDMLVRPGDAVLVKGSRGLRLEQVVEALVRRFPAREQG
jgi:UDP-N-acetylmuramoyl-tripeptide--D-alanyl-D-alanine ligase